MFKENYDTGEITVKIFVLDRMADALDLNYYSKEVSDKNDNKNSKKEKNKVLEELYKNKSFMEANKEIFEESEKRKLEKEYDIKDSNKLEIAVLLKEMKFKNRKEYYDFINKDNKRK